MRSRGKDNIAYGCGRASHTGGQRPGDTYYLQSIGI